MNLNIWNLFLENAPFLGLIKKFLAYIGYNPYFNDLEKKYPGCKKLLLRAELLSSKVFAERIIQEIHLMEKLKIKRNEIDGYIDVGANIGQNTISSRIYFDEDIPIYSFEPQKSSFDKLVKISKNLPNIFFFNYGVGEKNEILIFYRSCSSETSQASSFLKYSDLYKDEFAWGNAQIIEEQIEVISLDSFFIENNIDIGKNLFLHIDTEGYDFFVLKGCKEYLLDRVKYLVVEITFDLFKEEKKFEDIFLLIKDKFEFKGFIEPLVIGRNGDSLYSDALFIRKQTKGKNGY